MSTDIEKIRQLPSTKVEIGEVAERINQGLDDGSINPLELLKYFKALEKLNEAVKPMLDKMVLQEASKYPEKVIEAHGIKFIKKNGPAQWNYDNCNDAEQKLLKKYNEEYKKKLKDREEWLQKLTKSETMLDEDSGEVITINPPTKSQKELVQVNFE